MRMDHTGQLVRIVAGRFVAGMILRDGVVAETAPILYRLRGLREAAALHFCAKSGWLPEYLSDDSAVKTLTAPKPAV